ncbi:helix-turn-helix domain-containing protein [Maridesulfovibrio sp.]|uniref:helix-turn-helix domain-containing protein n=1 Tax=Maridesulfovibrio sp. TaxID=2795000 RepID=UPI003AFFBDD7
MTFFNQEKFAKRLIEVQKAYDLTQKGMAEQIGLNKPHTLKSYLDGNTLPNAETISLLVQKFDVDAHWLLTGEGSMKRGQNKAEERKLDLQSVKELFPIADTMRELFEHDLQADLDEVAFIAGMSAEELEACFSAKLQPPTLAIARWVRHYKINANFLAAQLGKPQLNELEMSGPLSAISERHEGRDDNLREAGKLSSPFVGTGGKVEQKEATDPIAQRIREATKALIAANADDRTIRQVISDIIAPAQNESPDQGKELAS